MILTDGSPVSTDGSPVLSTLRFIFSEKHCEGSMHAPHSELRELSCRKLKKLYQGQPVSGKAEISTYPTFHICEDALN